VLNLQNNIFYTTRENKEDPDGIRIEGIINLAKEIWGIDLRE
jgi:hypothetical protein